MRTMCDQCVHCENPDAPESLEYPIGVIRAKSDIHLEFALCEVCHRTFTLDVATFNEFNREPVTPEAVYSTLNSQIDQAIEEQTNSECEKE